MANHKRTVSGSYWRMALMVSKDGGVRLEAAQNIIASFRSGQAAQSPTFNEESAVTDLFKVLWSLDLPVEIRHQAAECLLELESLGPNQALALVPVVPQDQCWAAVVRAVELGVSYADLLAAAASIQETEDKATLINMIHVASQRSTDALFDWVESGASRSDLIEVARSGLDKVDVAAADVIFMSDDVTDDELLVLAGTDFPTEIRQPAIHALWDRSDHAGVRGYLDQIGL